MNLICHVRDTQKLRQGVNNSYLHALVLCSQVTKDLVVKLSDVGLTKREQSIVIGEKVGSLIYMAPEVLLELGAYGRQADIYSLSIILWEMWYGLDSAEHIQQQLGRGLSFEEMVKKGLRPSMSLTTKPTDEWRALITMSWDADPSKRPTAINVLSFFESYMKSKQRL